MEFFGFRITKTSEAQAAPVSDEARVRFVGDLQRLEPRFGDRYVLCISQRVSAETAARIRNLWERFAGKDVPLLILEDGMKLGAISMLDKAD